METATNRDRAYWLEQMGKIVRPVLTNGAEKTLRRNMPADGAPKDRIPFAVLEAVGRALVGIAPWLACKNLSEDEEQLRQELSGKARMAIESITDPGSPDFASFDPTYGMQPVVDAAFLAQAILRAPDELWEPLDPAGKRRLINAMRSSRDCDLGFNNWLLFGAAVEAFFCLAGEPWDTVTLGFILGRSSVYRFGAMQELSQIALKQNLPAALSPAQARSALTAVIRRTMEGDNFDSSGWLTIGVCGTQPSVAEPYISRGSVYLCTAVFPALGLEPASAFWSDPEEPWTSKKLWGGEDAPGDHAAVIA